MSDTDPIVKDLQFIKQNPKRFTRGEENSAHIEIRYGDKRFLMPRGRIYRPDIGETVLMLIGFLNEVLEEVRHDSHPPADIEK